MPRVKPNNAVRLLDSTNELGAYARYAGERTMRQVQLLTSRQVAGMLSVPEGTLRYWRTVGLGPVWHKLEGSIRYDVGDVLRYVEKNRRIPSVRAFMEEHDGSL